MKTKIEWSEVKKRYPDLLPLIEQKKLGSSSKSKNMPFADCRWELDWCQEFDSQSFDEVLQEAANPKPEPVLDVEAELKDQLSRIPVVVLKCRAGHGWWSTHINLTTHGMPAEVIASHFEWAQKEVAERNIVAAMAPLERAREAQNIILKLSGTPGFKSIRLGH